MPRSPRRGKRRQKRPERASLVGEKRSVRACPALILLPPLLATAPSTSDSDTQPLKIQRKYSAQDYLLTQFHNPDPAASRLPNNDPRLPRFPGSTPFSHCIPAQTQTRPPPHPIFAASQKQTNPPRLSSLPLSTPPLELVLHTSSLRAHSSCRFSINLKSISFSILLNFFIFFFLSHL